VFSAFLVALVIVECDVHAVHLRDGIVNISLQKTYELTKYLDKQLQFLTVNYVSHGVGQP
ncbi:hypothetical protein chiPu_0027780, partial [Chiloscyllium punctatum]|nr:hypothetical protein [Chiloscyllium punctatum]